MSFTIAMRFDDAFHPIKMIRMVGNEDDGLESFGDSISAGDINKDGYPDIIVGAGSRQDKKGGVYIIYGGPTTSLSNIEFTTTILDPLTTGFMISGYEADTFFGSSVSSAGDIDKDGYDDIIIGAQYGSRAYVVYGGSKSSLSNIDLATTTLSPLTTGFTITGFGPSSVVSSGDINKDGYFDMIIGGADQGAAYVVYGGPRSSMSNLDFSATALNPLTTGFKITGNAAGNAFGCSVSNSGDVNKDGYPDFIIGANQKNGYQGATYVVYGGPKSSMSNIDLSTATLNPLTTGFMITGNAGGDRFGSKVSSAGDFNNDGYADILIGAPGKASWKGAAYVIYGGPKSSLSNIDLSMTTLNPLTTGLMITGTATNTYFGNAVNSAGDINKDGYDEIIVGAETTSSSRGAAYVIYGGPKSSRSNIDLSTITLDPLTTGISIFGTEILEMVGRSVASSDINNDGHPDIMIGGIGGFYAGRVFVFLTQCPKSCETCSSASTCDVCLQGYDLKNSLCYRCPANCDICTVETSCDTCTSPYLLNSGQCVASCPTAKMFASNGKCLDCPAECTQCTSLSVCQGCVDGFKLTESQACAPICPAQTFLSNGKCQSCPTGCSACTSLSTCQGCNDGYKLTESQVCTKIICPSQTFISNGECQSCPAGCSRCTSPSTCQSCLDGFTLTELQVCTKKAQTTIKAEEVAEKDGQKAAVRVFEGTSLVGAALGFGSSLPLNFGLAAKILRNIKYMKLPVSHELEETFVSWKMPSEWISAPKSWNLEYSSKTIPTVFSSYGLQSAFLTNFWMPLVLALIGIALFGVFKLIEVSLKNKKGLAYIIVKQVNIGASSFALIEFYGNLDDVIFYFVLEMRSTEFETGFRICSSVIAIVLLFVGGVFIVLHAKLVAKYQRVKESSSSTQLEGRFENIHLIFKDFKDKNSFTQSFLMINVIRSMLSSLIFATLFDYPLVQISFLLALNILMIVYLCWKRSFKKLSNTLGQIFCEVVLLVAHICVFILALSNHTESDPVLSVDILSKCIIIINFVLLLGCALLLIVNLGRILYQSYLERRKTQPVLPKENDISASDQRLATNSGLINQSQSILQSDRNPLKTVPDDNPEKDSSNMAPQQEISRHSFVQNRTKNRNLTGGFNIEDLEESNQSNLFSNNMPLRSRPRELALARIGQGSKIKDSLRNKSPESRIQDPSLHSRMVIHQNSATANQDVSMTNLEL